MNSNQVTEKDGPFGEAAPEILDGRIWVDGCWDFFHHGHAGAMLQARQLGTELVVGIHSDESILENKGPTVMTLEERIAAVDACRWVTQSVPYAPYVTSLPWISHYGCKYVVHGDDITSDSSGEDCYRYVKAAGRFKVVKRTPSISTTDLVGRMLLCTRTHFIKSFTNLLDGEEGSGTPEERKKEGDEMTKRIKLYATDQTGLHPGSSVWFWTASVAARKTDTEEEEGVFTRLCEGSQPKPGQRVVYVDGGFDLFSSGHIEFLRQVIKSEEKMGADEGWYSKEAVEERTSKGSDYGPVFVIAGVHDDEVINHWKGVNYPIMNIYERGLCVLQCKYINSVIFGAPFTPTRAYLTSTPWGTPDAVYHGPTSFMPLTYDPYTAPKEMGIYREIGMHEYAGVNAGQIVQRIMKSRDMYEERQRVKGVKGIGEEAQRRREQMEEEQKLKESLA
ncbi:phosphoethanolamine cytidylyltransferase-like protein [Tricladium varicosporioides]|nr:phosphoethanolamine cytidylyltransferase-like protein [Hymenoscyphus varicosporioides]